MTGADDDATDDDAVVVLGVITTVGGGLPGTTLLRILNVVLVRPEESALVLDWSAHMRSPLDIFTFCS